MELRHLRCFVILAEELHFARAAERLHIEQSPLSRIIKELEYRIGIRLFNRDRRGTHLTRAGELFLNDVRRLFVVLEQALEGARAAAEGHGGVLHVAVSDGVSQLRLASLLALSREEEPTTTVRLTEATLSEQLRGLHDGTIDVGFARADDVGENIVSIPLWSEAVVAAIPSRHPLLAHALVPLDELLKFPLIACHPEVYEGYNRNIEQILRASNVTANIVERVTSLAMLLTLVSAGYGVALATAAQIEAYRLPDIVTRPISINAPSSLTTYLLRKADPDPPEAITAFINRTIRELGDEGG